LPRPDRLVKTGPVDHADWNYRGLLGWIQRRRFHMILSLIGDRRTDSILELGYGSGVFFPELSARCERYVGVDTHAFGPEVRASLSGTTTPAEFLQGTAERVPVPDASVDWVVAVSVFEFVDDMPAAARELRRVLRPGGSVFLVTPGASIVVDAGLKVLTGESASRDFANRRAAVVPSLRREFEVRRNVRFPPGPLIGGMLYNAYEFA
jgi:ubiquinone/menaquinone biosynthesis C-methylase UbiE